MTDHKLEPFEKVQVRDRMSCDWTADFFSHMDEDNFFCVGNSYLQCIPYTPETAHLLGTSQPYEPPKPPVEYEWGQKVEVYKDKAWVKGIISYTEKDSSYAAIVAKGDMHASIYPPDRIRPMPDTPANADD